MNVGQYMSCLGVNVMIGLRSECDVHTGVIARGREILCCKFSKIVHKTTNKGEMSDP